MPHKRNGAFTRRTHTSLRARLHWSKEYFCGVLRGFAKKRAGQLPCDPREYFERLSLEQYSQRHRAGNSELITDCLKGCACMTEESLGSVRRVYELGCGAGDLLRQLALPKSCEIMLVDFVRRCLPDAVQHLRPHFARLHQIHADLRTWTPEASEIADIAFAVNVLPYLYDPDCLFHIAQRVLRASGNCVLVYPRPSPVWEEEFDGVQLQFHTPANVMSHAASHGFSRTELAEITFAFPFPLSCRRHTIGYVDVFKKDVRQ